MEEFLRDSIWQFVGVILGLIAIVVTVIVFVLQRRKKSLVYEILANTSLLTVDEEIKGNMQILFDGTPVQKVHLMILRILNDGNVPITASDFEYPLKLDFGENAQILSADITKTEPANLKPELRYSTQSVMSLQPLLINSKDSIHLKFLLAQYDGVMEVDARINGVKEVNKISNPRILFTSPIIGGWLIILSLIAMGWLLSAILDVSIVLGASFFLSIMVLFIGLLWINNFIRKK